MLGGSGANRTVTLTPAAGLTGVATVTLQVTDANGGISTDTFTLTVNSVANTAPTISNVNDVTIRSGQTSNPINFTIGDAETAADLLTVSASTSNPALITNLSLAGTGSSRSLVVRAKSGQPAGSAQVTLSVSDGVNVTQETFTVNVEAAVIGDSNNDGHFDSADLIAVFVAGEYEDAVEDNSVWETGDWNGDGDFNTTDLVYAFQAGTYESGPAAKPALTQAQLVDLVLALDGSDD